MRAALSSCHQSSSTGAAARDRRLCYAHFHWGPGNAIEQASSKYTEQVAQHTLHLQ